MVHGGTEDSLYEHRHTCEQRDGLTFWNTQGLRKMGWTHLGKHQNSEEFGKYVHACAHVNPQLNACVCGNVNI